MRFPAIVKNHLGPLSYQATHMTPGTHLWPEEDVVYEEGCVGPSGGLRSIGLVAVHDATLRTGICDVSKYVFMF